MEKVKEIITKEYPTRYVGYENKGVLIVNENSFNKDLNSVPSGFEYAIFYSYAVEIEVTNFQNKSVVVYVFAPYCDGISPKHFNNPVEAIDYVRNLIPKLIKETYENAYKHLIHLQVKENDYLITKRGLKQEIKDSDDKIAKRKKELQLEQLEKELEAIEKAMNKLRYIVNIYENKFNL